MKNKMMKVFDTTTKKIVAIVITILLVVTAGYGVYALTTQSNIDAFTLALKKEPLVLEYGTTISTDAKEYLVFNDDQEKHIKKVKVEIKIDNQEGKEYPDIGKYDVTISYDKQKVKTTVEIKDTKAPMFNETNEVTFEQGADFDYAAVIKAEDLQEVEYSFYTTLVNKDVIGEYIAKATAKDKSGNEATKDIKVIVTEKTSASTPGEVTNSDSTSTNGNGSTSTPNANASGGGNTTKPTKPSTGGGSTKPTPPAPDPAPTPTPEPTPPPVHKHVNAAFGKYFATDKEAHAWAENYIDTQPIGQYIYSGYGVHYCSCGLHSVSFY